MALLTAIGDDAAVVVVADRGAVAIPAASAGAALIKAPSGEPDRQRKCAAPIICKHQPDERAENAALGWAVGAQFWKLLTTIEPVPSKAAALPR